MKVLVLYDSFYGNTKKVALAIGDGFSDLKADCRIRHVTESIAADFAAADLVVVGSPTRGFRAMDAVVRYLKDPAHDWKGKRVAAFDTRIDPAEIRFGLFRRIVTSFGYAADQIAKLLDERGAVRVAPTMGFLVTGREGTVLGKGEEDRAFDWAKALAETIPAPEHKK